MRTIPISPLELSGAFVIGLLASGHCLVMCGGVSAAFGMATSERQALLLTLFSLGRVACYGLLGVFVGSLSQWLGSVYLPLMEALRVAAGLLLIAIAAYVGQWWLGLKHLERLGLHLWQRIQPVAQRLIPIHSPSQALLLGALWGFLPCGLIYSTLLWASLQTGSAVGAGLLMVAFGLGTLPAMVGIGLIGQRGRQMLRGPSFRRMASVVLVVMGVWTMAAALWTPHAMHESQQHDHHGGHAVHGVPQNL